MSFPQREPAVGAFRMSPRTGVIVTGGASGIGLASAKALAAAGRPISVWDIQRKKAEAAAAALRQTYGVPTIGLGVDVRDLDAMRMACETTRAALPSIGGLVHSAGVTDRGGVEGFDPAAWDSGMSIHVRPIPLIVQSILPDLARHPGSSVVAIASMQARLGDGRVPTYTAAKGAIVSLVRSMADALASHGVRINSVSPGMIRTPMLERAMPLGPLLEATKARAMLERLGEPAEVAAAVRFLMSDEASFITATDLLVDGGYTASARRFAPPP